LMRGRRGQFLPGHSVFSSGQLHLRKTTGQRKPPDRVGHRGRSVVVGEKLTSGLERGPGTAAGSRNSLWGHIIIKTCNGRWPPEEIRGSGTVNADWKGETKRPKAMWFSGKIKTRVGDSGFSNARRRDRTFYRGENIHSDSPAAGGKGNERRATLGNGVPRPSLYRTGARRSAGRRRRPATSFLPIGKTKASFFLFFSLG